MLVLIESGRGAAGKASRAGDLGRAVVLSRSRRQPRRGMLRDASACTLERSRAAGADIDHGFTHFRLRITAGRCTGDATDAGRRSPAGSWLSVEEALGAAIPAPVKRILRALRARARVAQPQPDRNGARPVDSLIGPYSNDNRSGLQKSLQLLESRERIASIPATVA